MSVLLSLLSSCPIGLEDPDKPITVQSKPTINSNKGHIFFFQNEKNNNLEF